VKNSFKFLGILALVALIGFSMISCDNSGPGGDPIPEGAANWPPNSTLNQFGLNGKPAPTGAFGVEWGIAGHLLFIEFNGTAATRTAVRNWLTVNNWELHDEGGGWSEWLKGNFVLLFDYEHTGNDFNFFLTAAPLSTGWPPNSYLNKFGLGGKPQPTDASNIEWIYGSDFLSINFHGTLATRNAVTDWLTANGWTEEFVGSEYWLKGNLELVFFEYTVGYFSLSVRVYDDDFSSSSANLAPLGSNLLENESNNDNRSARPNVARRSNIRR